jgi:hypothetical protein
MYNLIFGILFIIGGGTGMAVLKGTNSTVGLIIVGVVLTVIGAAQMAGGSSKKSGTGRRSRGGARGANGRQRGGGRRQARASAPAQQRPTKAVTRVTPLRRSA